MYTKFSTIFLSILITSALALCSCAKPAEPPTVPEQPVSQEKLQALAPTPTPTPDMSKLPPPNLSEVQEAVKRVFKDAAIVDTTRKPSFIVGDYNGDLSQDLAVTLKPIDLSELNAELPTWMLRDPLTPDLSPQESAEARRSLHIGQTDPLLAIIHGHEADGWRNPDATQTFLLKEPPNGTISTMSLQEFRNENKRKKMPALYGDLIKEAIPGTPGLIYYTGGSYAWYDPQRPFKVMPELAPGHPRVGSGGAMKSGR